MTNLQIQNPISELLQKRGQNREMGLYSCCSANEYVIRAALRRAKDRDTVVLVEATANQVNQNGGYTGMTPVAFRAFLNRLAEEENFPIDKLFCGGNGELKAAMQYMSQSFRIRNPKIKDLFMDIAAEELSHMEMVAQTINLLNGHDVEADKVQAGEIETHVLLGLNPGLINASGYSWTADYVTVTGDLCADLLSNIASEQRAKVVYEYLYRQIEDKKVRETIDFLLNREEAHNQMFRDAFNEVQDSGSNQDFGTTKAAKMYFSLSNPGPNAFAGNEVSGPKFAK